MSTPVKVAIFLGLLFTSLFFGWISYLIYGRGKKSKDQKKQTLAQRLRKPMGFAFGILSLASIISGVAIFTQ